MAKSGITGKVHVVGELADVSMGGDNKDLATVSINFMGGSFQFFADNELYNLCKPMQIGDPIGVEFIPELDAKAAGKNKLKPKRGTCKLLKASGG